MSLRVASSRVSSPHGPSAGRAARPFFSGLGPVRPTDLLGVLAMIAGLAIPAPALVALLRVPPPELQDDVFLGVEVLKLGLVALGLVILALARISLGGAARARVHHPASATSWAACGLILLLATALRLYALDSGLWFDEILAYVSYARLPFGEILTTYDSQNQHFLFSLLAHAAIVFFGDSAWSLRLPAVLFGVASIWALFLLGSYVAGTREGLLSAALLAVSYHHIWFSQNARGYTGLLFWTVLSSWLLIRALREGGLGLHIAYAAAAALGVYTHMTMLFVIIGHGLVYLGWLVAELPRIRFERWAGLILGFGLTGFFTLLLHALVLPQIVFGHAIAEVSEVPAWTNPLWTLLELSRGLQLSFAGSLVAAGALLIFSAGLTSYLRSAPSLVALLVIPVAVCAAVVIGTGHHLWPRFFFFAMGFAVLVVVRGAIVAGQLVGRAIRTTPARGTVLGTAFAAGLVLISALAVPLAYRPKQDFAGALAFVESQRQPGDAVAMSGLATMPYTRLYDTDWQDVTSVEALDAVRARANRTWFVFTLSAHLQAVRPELLAKVQQEFELVRQFDGSVGDGAIWVYRAHGSPGDASGAQPHAGADGIGHPSALRTPDRG